MDKPEKTAKQDGAPAKPIQGELSLKDLKAVAGGRTGPIANGRGPIVNGRSNSPLKTRFGGTD